MAGARFWSELSYLCRLAGLSNPFSRGGRLLVAQFCLLVMKTLVTVRCSKLCVYFLTRAIAQASWKYWVRWMFNFLGWTCAGVVVNSGLKYTESLIELEVRDRLRAGQCFDAPHSGSHRALREDYDWTDLTRRANVRAAA